MSNLAERYERIYPETGIPEAQKEERMDRMQFKHETAQLRRTSRNRGIIVPASPAFDSEGRLRP